MFIFDGLCGVVFIFVHVLQFDLFVEGLRLNFMGGSFVGPWVLGPVDINFRLSLVLAEKVEFQVILRRP